MREKEGLQYDFDALAKEMERDVIPSPINQNRCAQSRNPIDIMVQG